MSGEYRGTDIESAGAVRMRSYLVMQDHHSMSLPGAHYSFVTPVSLPAMSGGIFATIAAPYAAAVADQKTEDEFRRLSDTWKSETGMLSRVDKRCMHYAYQKIIALGEKAIPFILRDLRDTQDSWFWALTVIAGEDAIPDDTPDNIDSLVEAWLSWGRENGYDV